ncbi:hypothetical protein [Saccharopolyspora rosea]|uniref:Uncharacterized protein n=1 Tax=Saccharopolyspora rosea TaxID=524884 RepID=A0ABW3FKL6_9PSEU|nr:hypothetical protein [Saccharopolyspora rosea]
MADRIVIPEDLAQRFGMLRTAGRMVESARDRWNALDPKLLTAAGNDDETSEAIKKQAKDVNPAISELLDSLTQVLTVSGDHGQQVSNAFEHVEEDNADQAKNM